MEKKLTESKHLFEEFINKLRSAVFSGEELPEFSLPEDDRRASEIIARTLHELSQFIYSQSPKTKGKKTSEDLEYFSEFHKFWEDNHEKILSIEIDDERCHLVAERLEQYCRPYDFKELVDTHGLSKEMIANVRLFVTIQDFGVGFKVDYYELGKEVPYLFRARAILDRPAHIPELETVLGVADYQTDKRREWAYRLAELLDRKYDGEAYNIGPYHEFSAKDIRRTFKNAIIGLGDKKLNMFLRDMQRHGVWELKDYEDVGVASDMNTMRVALRTGILKTQIPLLSSFLDVFCYQYEAIDSATERAWRRVWEIWDSIPNSHCVPSPADIDYAIYRLGRRCCGKTRRYCDNVRELDVPLSDHDSYPINRLMQRKKLSYCIFTGICDDENTNQDRKKLNPPRSISRRGRYGWINSTSNEGGGLGLRA